MLTGSAYVYPVCGWEAKLEMTFGNVFGNEDVDIHPTKFCSGCHAKIRHKETRGSETLISPVTWVVHSGDDCVFCIKRGRRFLHQGWSSEESKKMRSSETNNGSC